MFKAGFLFSKKLKPEQTQRPNNSRIFQPETEQSGSDSSHIDFETQFTHSVKRNKMLWTNFPQNMAI